MKGSALAPLGVLRVLVVDLRSPPTDWLPEEELALSE
jgi:hypothetical protein